MKNLPRFHPGEKVATIREWYSFTNRRTQPKRESFKMPKLLTLTQAAKRVGISIKTLRLEIKAGRFPRPVKRNSRWVRVPETDVESYLKQLSEQRSNPQPTEAV
jgi:predicted DNA-binding transcriptional regulator AlpA